MLAGVVASNSMEWMTELGEIQKINGAVLSPFDAYLLGRGLKTLAVRMQFINSSAMRLAEYLSSHPKVDTERMFEQSRKMGHASIIR